MRKIRQFFNISNCDHNPLMVEATIVAELENNEWTWQVDQIHTVETVIANKEGIDLTRQVLSNPRALALITSQVSDCSEQVYEALSHNKISV
jgi:hypothetical protein